MSNLLLKMNSIAANSSNLSNFSFISLLLKENDTATTHIKQQLILNQKGDNSYQAITPCQLGKSDNSY